MVWCNRYKQRNASKLEIGKELVPVAWQLNGGIDTSQKIRKKK